jgi:hypothetical protein
MFMLFWIPVTVGTAYLALLGHSIWAAVALGLGGVCALPIADTDRIPSNDGVGIADGARGKGQQLWG